MSAAVTVPQGVELCHLPSPFALASGEALHGASLAYERQGPAGAPVVVALGGISAHRHVVAHPAVPQRGWWPGVVGRGPTHGVDTDRFQLLSFDWLGGAGQSTAPDVGDAFPAIDAQDQARALWALCSALRIDRVHAIVGSSYGGMVAQHAAALAPSRCERLVVLAAADRAHAQASAWRAVQRELVELGVARGCAAEALALARQLAMTTYRAPAELGARFAGGLDDAELRGWLSARGAAFVREWNAEQFLCLNRSIDAHRIDAAAIAAPTWLCAFDSDQLVPPAQVRDLALRLPDLRGHRELRTVYGHDGFLKETRAVSAFVREALR